MDLQDGVSEDANIQLEIIQRGVKIYQNFDKLLLIDDANCD